MTDRQPTIRRLSDELRQMELNFEDTVIYSRLTQFEKQVTDSGLSIKMALKGTENYFIQGRHYALQPGRYLIVNRHQQFDCRIRSGRAVEALCLYLSEEVINDTYEKIKTPNELDQPALEKAGTAPLHFLEKLYTLEENELGAFLRNLAPLLLTADSRQVDLPLVYYSLAEKLIRNQLQVDNRLRRLSATRRSTREELYRRLSLAHQYILENYTSDLQLDQLTQVAYLSKFHLLRTYKEVFGVTPYRQALNLRLEKALELIRRDLSLEEVAFQLGFSDRRAFAKAFRKHYGIAPSAYRER